jgi:2,4-dichlorophenol 6-monooxygenase
MTTAAHPQVETDVLVVGSGPAGAAAALFLATYGTPTLLVTKYSRLSDSPRAHITNQRTMETMRDAGIEDRLMREATPWELMGNTTFCTSLAGEELGRIPSWGTDTVRHANYELQSPCTMLDAPQTITEPIMVAAAQERGARIRFDTEYLSHVQDDEGVTTLVLDRLTGAEYAIRSRYLVGADGARSKVAADAGLPFEGPGAVGG